MTDDMSWHIEDLELPSVLEGRARLYQEAVALTTHLTSHFNSKDSKALVQAKKIAPNNLDIASTWLLYGAGGALAFGLLGLTLFMFSPFLFTTAAIGFMGSRLVKKLAHERYRHHTLPELQEEICEILNNPLNHYASELKETIVRANAQFALWNHRVSGFFLGVETWTDQDEKQYRQLKSLKDYLRRRIVHLQYVHDLEKIRQGLKNRGLSVDRILTELDLHLQALATQESSLLEPILKDNDEDQLTNDANNEVEEALKSNPKTKIDALENDDFDLGIEEKIEPK